MPSDCVNVMLTSMQKVCLESRYLAHNVPRLFLKCPYPVQDTTTILSGQATWVVLCLHRSLPAAGRCPCRTRRLHELLFIAPKRISFAIPIPIDAYALATCRRHPEARPATQFTL